jgi:hypothetical protein
LREVSVARPKDFVSWIGIVPDPRIVGMVTYPLGEILLVALVGTLCRMEDWKEIVYFAEEQLEWLRRFLPFENGVASAKTGLSGIPCTGERLNMLTWPERSVR